MAVVDVVDVVHRWFFTDLADDHHKRSWWCFDCGFQHEEQWVKRHDPYRGVGSGDCDL